MERLNFNLNWHYPDRPHPLGSRSAKAPIYRLVEGLGRYFVPIVSLLAIVTGSLCWVSIGNLSLAIDTGVGVLIIACPYALGLAIPMATIVATRKGARQGILVKNSRSLKLLQRANIIVFDRDSILATGKQTVTDFIPVVDNYHGNDFAILQLAASIEACAKHPFALAIVDRAKAQRLQLKSVTEFHSVSGGVQGIVDGKLIQVGSSAWFATLKIATVLQAANCQILANYQQQWEAAGKQVVWIAIDREIAGIFGISDAFKPTAAVTISNLKKIGLEAVLLTEDNLIHAQRIADDIGFDRVFAQIKPQAKAEIIRDLQSTSSGKHPSIVAMVGSGNSNTLELAQADIRIAIETGVNSSITNSDIGIISPDLRAIVAAIDLNRSALNIIKEKLLLAFICNLIFVLLMTGIFYILISRSPISAIAIFAMVLSSLLVLISCLRRC
jgi:Cu+-exporting ATPase